MNFPSRQRWEYCFVLEYLKNLDSEVAADRIQSCTNSREDICTIYGNAPSALFGQY
jgi:hypothetical protein